MHQVRSFVEIMIKPIIIWMLMYLFYSTIYPDPILQTSVGGAVINGSLTNSVLLT